MATKSILESILPTSESFEPLLPLVPSHKNYYEHSCNQLNLFGALSPTHKGSVNSKDTYFIDFLNSYQTDAFKVEVNRLSKAWKLLSGFGKMLIPELEIVYDDLSQEYLSKDDLPFVIRAIVVTNMDNPKYDAVCNPSFTINLDSFTDKLIDYLINSLILNLNCDSRNNLKKAVGYSVKQGFIAHFKEMVQQQDISIPKAQFTAIWFFNHLFKGKTKLPTSTFVDNAINQLYDAEMTHKLASKKYTNLAFADFIKSQEMSQDDLLVLSMPEKSIDEKLELIKGLESQVLILTQNTKMNHQYQQELGFNSVNILGQDSLLIIKNY